MVLKFKSDKPLEFVDFVRLPCIILKLVGYDFLNTRKPKWLTNTMWIFMIFAVTCHFYSKFFMFKEFFALLCSGDVITAVRVGTYLYFSLDANIKSLALVINHKRMRNIFNILEQAYPKTMQERQGYCVNEYYWSKAILTIITIYFGACYSILATPVLQAVFLYFSDLHTLGYDSANFAYLRCVPLEYNFNHRTPIGYSLAYIIDVLSCHTSIATNMGSDTWLMCLTSQVCMHLKYVGLELKSHDPLVENSKEDCEFLVTILKKHQFLLGLHHELNGIFGVSLLFSLLSCTTVLVFTAAQLSFEKFGWSYIIYFIFFMTVMSQFALVCYHGQKLITTSTDIATYAYDSTWYNGSNEYKKLLLLMMMRAQKQAELSAQGFQQISLDTFKIVMGMTYRVVALIQTMI